MTSNNTPEPLSPEVVSAILRDPDSPYYPTQITVFCDHCGTEQTGDYLVRDDMSSEERLAVARTHLVNNEGWEHTGDGDDFCPVHAGSPDEEQPADRPYTDADLRAEAARQHARFTAEPDLGIVGEVMENGYVPSVETDEDGSARTWTELLEPEGEETREYTDASRAVCDLIRGAADVSAWAVELGVEGLVPAEQRLVHSVEDGPVHAAFHIALDRRLELDKQAYDAIADVIRAHLLIREDSTPAVEQPAAEACGKCKQPFDPADTRFDGRARHYLTPYCCGCVDRCHDTEIADHRCVICA